MTSIVSLAFRNEAVIFGDLLLTGERFQNDSRVRIPSQGDVTDFFGDAWGIRGLCQKVVVVAPNCVLAWAGDWLGARLFVAELREISQRSELTKDVIYAHLDGRSEIRNYETSVTGWVMQGTTTSAFNIGMERLRHPSFDGLSMAGSGKDLIKRFLASRFVFPREQNNLELAVSFFVEVAGTLMREEVADGDGAASLHHACGGGYEIAYRTQQGFAKMNNVVFHFWKAHLLPDGDVALNIPSFVYKQQYVNDYLYIHAAKIDNVVDPMQFEEETFRVPPMYECQPPVNAPSPSYDGDCYIHHFDLGELGSYSYTQGLNTDQPVVQVIRTGPRGGTIRINQEKMLAVVAPIHRILTGEMR